jgi:hypothetical protein
MSDQEIGTDFILLPNVVSDQVLKFNTPQVCYPTAWAESKAQCPSISQHVGSQTRGGQNANDTKITG